ncbi:hypothetical protein TIFTF001_009281 [Ficus carica]|uniref:Uncharacterized protein n=1 Tax=Ficus carica TaxID=3494 RepID=A0AA87ZUD2_FICCA|nr:hypothetical protein TIFTF001_009281 [Ficus carica]
MYIKLEFRNILSLPPSLSCVRVLFYFICAPLLGLESGDTLCHHLVSQPRDRTLSSTVKDLEVDVALWAGFDHIVKAELGTCDVRECVLRVSGFVVVFTGVRCMGPPKRLDLGGFGPCSMASLSGGLGRFGPYSVASLFRGDGLQH